MSTDNFLPGQRVQATLASGRNVIGTVSEVKIMHLYLTVHGEVDPVICSKRNAVIMPGDTSDTSGYNARGATPKGVSPT